MYNGRIKKSGQAYYTENNGLVVVGEQFTQKPYFVVPGFGEHPVVAVNWFGAQLFAQSLGYRLPSVLEWELAATGKITQDYLYPWGNMEPSPQFANYAELVGKTTKVGSYPPTDTGLYDMAGNVREWCADLIDEQCRFIKGGGWNKPAHDLQIRTTYETWCRHSGASIGFRVCCNDPSNLV